MKTVTKKASLKKDIFDAWIYTDNNKNEINFSKEYWGGDILKDHKNSETSVFVWLLEMCENLKDYKEKYHIDIFGYQQYENNQKEKASLKKDIFDKYIYEDSKRNKVEFDEKEWTRYVKRYRSDKKAFMDLIQRNLFRD